MKKTILVTGGSGFIGANLVRKLLENKQNKVIVMVGRESDLWRLEDVKDEILIYKGCLEDKPKLTRLIKKIKPEIIIHTAIYGSYPFQKDVNRMIDINIKAMQNLLDVLKEISFKHLIITASSSEYGEKSKMMNEDDVCEPGNIYALTKLAQTNLARIFSQTYQKSVLILRLFNVYGPFEEKGRLVRSVVESVLLNKPILLATGKEARDLIFIDDVTGAIVRCFTLNKIFKGEIFNIGTGKQTTIKELAEKVVKLTKSSSEIKLHAYEGRIAESFHWQADTRKTGKYLKWKAKYSLKKGLLTTIDWYKKQN